jgi:hypothetical protein
MMIDSEPQTMEIAEMSESDAVDVLRSFCDNGFHGSLEDAGLVLGRPVEELQRMIEGVEPVDEDLVMKVRGIAQERGIDIGLQLAADDEEPSGE